MKTKTDITKTINPTEVTKKRKYTKKIKVAEEKPIELVATRKSMKKKAEVIETYSKIGIEIRKHFEGTKGASGFSLMDELLKGKKIPYKTKYIVYMTNVKNHGKIMSEQRAMESGPAASDFFFDPKKYIKPHFIVMEKKGKNVIYDDESFIQFCDVLGKL